MWVRGVAFLRLGCVDGRRALLGPWPDNRHGSYPVFPSASGESLPGSRGLRNRAITFGKTPKHRGPFSALGPQPDVLIRAHQSPRTRSMSETTFGPTTFTMRWTPLALG